MPSTHRVTDRANVCATGFDGLSDVSEHNMLWIYLTIGAACGAAVGALVSRKMAARTAAPAPVPVRHRYLGGIVGAALGLLAAGLAGSNARNLADAANTVRERFAMTDTSPESATQGAKSSLLKDATADTFAEHIGQGLVIVDFWADWCGPCHLQMPILERFAQKSGEAVKIVKVNVDRDPQIAEQYGVTGLPSLVFFCEGEVIGGLVGVQDERTLDLAVEKVREISAEKKSASAAGNTTPQ